MTNLDDDLRYIRDNLDTLRAFLEQVFLCFTFMCQENYDKRDCGECPFWLAYNLPKCSFEKELVSSDDNRTIRRLINWGHLTIPRDYLRDIQSSELRLRRPDAVETFLRRLEYRTLSLEKYQLFYELYSFLYGPKFRRDYMGYEPRFLGMPYTWSSGEQEVFISDILGIIQKGIAGYIGPRHRYFWDEPHQQSSLEIPEERLRGLIDLEVIQKIIFRKERIV